MWTRMQFQVHNKNPGNLDSWSFFLNKKSSFWVIPTPIYFLLAEKIEASAVTAITTFNHNFILQGSSTNRTKDRNSTATDSTVNVLSVAMPITFTVGGTSSL